jgi:hypothetical protein
MICVSSIGEHASHPDQPSLHKNDIEEESPSGVTRLSARIEARARRRAARRGRRASSVLARAIASQQNAIAPAQSTAQRAAPSFFESEPGLQGAEDRTPVTHRC